MHQSYPAAAIQFHNLNNYTFVISLQCLGYCTHQSNPVTSQLTNSKSFNNCIVSEWLRLYIFFLPLMGSWLPAGQQVIQLQIPFLSLLLWTTPDSKCCSSGSQGNRLKTLWLTCKRFIVVYFWEHLWGSKEGRKFELAHICNSECHQLHRDLKS